MAVISDAVAPLIADLIAPAPEPEREVASKEDRRFYVGLALAILFHSFLFVGVFGATPRNIGDPSGDKDAINVEFVSEADLRSLTAAQDKPTGEPVPPAPPPAPVEAEAPRPPPEMSEPAPQPAEQEAARAPAPPESAVPEAALTLKPPEEEPHKTETKPEPKQATPQKAEPTPPAKQAKPARQQMARLDLSPPPMFAPGAGGAGMERPPGITRSGENDAFARGVVSALRRTMPQLNDSAGRVTVRITLDMDGSLVSTQVVRPSNVAGLDRHVVFSTRQASYPFPPRNAKSADLVFLITYIYH